MPWGAVVGAGIGLIGASMQSSAAGDAANAQLQGATNATAEQQREFNTVQGLYAPQRNLGYSALGQLGSLYGFGNPNTGGPPGSPQAGPGGGGMNPNTTNPNNPNYAGFYNSPGFQFSLGLGQQGVNRNAAAAGSLYAPNTMAAVGANQQGIASTHYNDYVQQLLAMAGLGGQATAGSANNAYATGANISTNALSAGNANASGILGSAGAWNNVIGANSGGSGLSNPNLNWGNLFGGGGGIPSDSGLSSLGP
jgi:hypothetical protein